MFKESVFKGGFDRDGKTFRDFRFIWAIFSLTVLIFKADKNQIRLFICQFALSRSKAIEDLFHCPGVEELSTEIEEEEKPDREPLAP